MVVISIFKIKELSLKLTFLENQPSWTYHVVQESLPLAQLFWFKPLLNIGTTSQQQKNVDFSCAQAGVRLYWLHFWCMCVYICVYVCIFFFIKIVTFPRCGLSSAQPTSLYEPVWIAVAVLLTCNFRIRKLLFPWCWRSLENHSTASSPASSLCYAWDLQTSVKSVSKFEALNRSLVLCQALVRPSRILHLARDQGSCE